MEFTKTAFWVQIHNVPLLYMTKDIGFFLGALIGDVVDLDVGASGDCYGKYIHVRVVVDITQPLKRFLKVKIMAAEAPAEAIDQNFKFGVWLRASSPRRSVSRGSTSASADGSDSRNEAGVGKERVHTSVLFGTPSKEATAPSPSLFVDTPNPFPTSKLSDFEGRRCTPIVCPVSSERRFDHQHSSGQDGIASGAVKTSIMRMGKELPLATHKYIIDDSLGSKRVEIVSPLDASGDLVDVALHGTVPSSEFLHDSYAHVVSGPVVHEDVFYFNEGASSSTPTPLHGSVDYIGTTKPVSTRKRSRWKRLAHEGMLLDPVCPARSYGHSQGTVRFGSSGVAPPQRPHSFASPPPNQDLNQLLILKY
ncbi:hypothetical protein ACOSQ2_016389 [Xanthoceras sorbifolium]